MALGDATRAWKNRRIAATIALAQATAGKAESHMKAQAEWTDRSGLARQGLTATPEVVRRGDRITVSIVLAHTMEYGGWIETIHGAAMGRRAGMSPRELAERENAGNLAIIWPTADLFGPRFLHNAKRLWAAGGAA